MKKLAWTAAAALAGVTMSASVAVAAITTNVTTGSLSTVKAAEAAFLSGLSVPTATEDFEGFTADQNAPLTQISTAVGTFRDITPSTNTPTDGLLVLDSGTTPFSGRRNTTSGGANWLDSNDSKKVKWVLDLAFQTFDIGFILSDFSDVSATMRVRFRDGTNIDTNILPGSGGSNSNGSLAFVESSFTQAATSVTFLVDSNNDGWGIDDVTVSAVPLPAGIALMGLGLAGFGGARVMQKRRKA
ncbi:MAG: VPLPA-CTERM sorting domain-containing protein [Planctomycetes bacterium]|nr:VPLPA-CTERM sorting domain-containing protein [Planctomycetota bacterium]